MQLLALLLWCLNLGISIWNAVAVGRAWVETNHAGGFRRLVAWAGAVMAAVGFTWCYLLLLAVLAAALGFLTPDAISAAVELGYLLVIPGLLLAGFVIMLDSWARAYRQHTLGNFGLAGYNTFAEAYNSYQAISGVPSAFRYVLSFLGGGQGARGRKSLSTIVVGVVLIVLLAGVLTTWMIIAHFAARGAPAPSETSPSL